MKLAEVPAFAPNGAETKPYSLEEIVAMLNVLSEPSVTVVATAAFTGLRLGELRGLTWESYEPAQDEESLGWLNVTRSVWSNIVGDPKTAKIKGSRGSHSATGSKSGQSPQTAWESAGWTNLCQLSRTSARPKRLLSTGDERCAQASRNLLAWLARVPQGTGIESESLGR